MLQLTYSTNRLIKKILLEFNHKFHEFTLRAIRDIRKIFGLLEI